MLHAKRLPVALVTALALVAVVCVDARAWGAQETRSIREVGGFDSVRFGTSGELIITQGDRESLEVVARAGDLPYIVTEVSSGTLSISRRGDGPFLSFRTPVFRLTMKTISSLETHSSGSISARGVRADSLRIRISSSGGVSIASLAASSLEVLINSSGSLRAEGTVDRQDVLLSSSGNYSAGGLECKTARVRVSSSGSATLRVSDSLDASVTSSGDVRYYGNPAGVNGNVTSSGRLVRLGD